MKKPEIKAMFFDVDGTLASYERHAVTEEDRESLRILHDKGIRLFIATGRDLTIRNENRILEPILPYLTGFVSSNGQQSFLQDGTTIAAHPIHAEDFLHLRDCCEAHHIAMLYADNNQPVNYITELTDHVRNFAAHVGLPIPEVRPMDPELTSVIKICIYCSPEEEETLLKPLMPHCWTARATRDLIDVIPNGVGKGAGLYEVCDYYGIPREQSMAFGDGDNDLDMIEAAGIGVAMGNALEKIKAAATYVTSPSADSGITRALEHYGLIEAKTTVSDREN